MVAGEHRGAEHQHRVVECCAFPLLDRIEFTGNVANLLQEKLIHLEPVCGVAMGQKVVNHVIDTKIWETQRGVIVVQLKRANSRCVRLESEHQNVAHKTHMLGNVLRNSIRRARDIWFAQRWAPALELAALTSILNPGFDFANRVEVLVELPLIERTHLASHVFCIL